MFNKQNPYFTKEVEVEYSEPHLWSSSENGLWMYNLMQGFRIDKDNNFDAAFKRAVKMLTRGKTNGKPTSKSKRKQ